MLERDRRVERERGVIADGEGLRGGPREARRRLLQLFVELHWHLIVADAYAAPDRVRLNSPHAPIAFAECRM